MNMVDTANLFLILIIVPTLNATVCQPNSKTTHAMGASEERKCSNTDDVNTNSNLVDPTEDIPLKYISKSMPADSVMSEELDGLIDTKISDKFEAILKFESILMEGKSKLLSSLPREERDYNYERLLQSASRTTRSCSDDINLVIAAAKMRIQWALEMIGANGEPGLDTLRDPVRSVGDFDQCMDVDTRQGFEGRYCTTNILISEIHKRNVTPPLPFSLGLCFPSSCDGAAVEGFINEYFEGRDDILATATKTHCRDRQLKFSTTAKIVIGFSSFYVAILVIATVYDVFYKRWWLEIKENGYHKTDNNVLKSEAATTKTSNSVHESSMDSKNQEAKLNSQNKSAIPKKSNKSGLVDQCLMTFSMYTNTFKLLSIDDNIDRIGCINGLRFISICQVVLVHLVVWSGETTDNNRVYLDDSYKKRMYMLIYRGDLSADTSFTIGGLVTALGLVKQFSQKAPTPNSLAKLYLHRMWRVLPVTVLTMITCVPLMQYAWDGPFWPEEGFERTCSESWWYTLLFLTNFKRLDNWCMGWTWYTSCDMQFYIVSPLMLMPLIYYGWKGILSPILFILASMICSGVITSVYDLVAVRDYEFLLTKELDDFVSHYYVKPYNRIGPYVLGLLIGFVLVKTDMKVRLPKWTVILGWTATAALLLATTFGLYDHVKPDLQLSIFARSLLNALSRNVWSLGICWVIFACVNGYGGIVNKVLGCKAFVLLGKLSFCAIMIHTFVMQYFLFSRSSLIRINNAQMTHLFVSCVVLTYIFGYVAHIVFEVPMAGLVKIVKARAKKRD